MFFGDTEKFKSLVEPEDYEIGEDHLIEQIQEVKDEIAAL